MVNVVFGVMSCRLLLEIWRLDCRRKAQERSMVGLVGGVGSTRTWSAGVGWRRDHHHFSDDALSLLDEKTGTEDRDISVIRSARSGVPFELVLKLNSSGFEASRAKLRRFQCKAAPSAHTNRKPPTVDHQHQRSFFTRTATFVSISLLNSAYSILLLIVTHNRTRPKGI